MTTTADTPLQRAAKAMVRSWNCDPDKDFQGEPSWMFYVDSARAALVAALQVRWTDGGTAVLGKLAVGDVFKSKHGWIARLDIPDGYERVADLTSEAEAKSAVQRAVIEAILGESLT